MALMAFKKVVDAMALIHSGCMTYVKGSTQSNRVTFDPLPSFPSFCHRPPSFFNIFHHQQSPSIFKIFAHTEQKRENTSLSNNQQSHDQVATVAKVLESYTVCTSPLHVAADKSWIIEGAFSSTAANTFHG
jgi:hypothetical protein